MDVGHALQQDLSIMKSSVEGSELVLRIAFVSYRDLSGMHPIWRSCRRAGKQGDTNNNTEQITSCTEDIMYHMIGP